MLCVVIKGPRLEEIKQQMQEALPLADLLELRFDLFIDFRLDQIETICADFPLPLIFTLRSASQGGDSRLSGEERLSWLTLLAGLKPQYLDVEYPDDVSFIPDWGSSKLILSHHDLEKTPADLQELYEEMQKTPAHFYKIAVKAEDTQTAMQLVCWRKQHEKNDCIAISMGPAGQISRILSPVIGNPITYACLNEDPHSPLGQLSAQRLINPYQISSLTSQTAVYGLIGDPVTQSISDITHNHYFKMKNLDAVYVKIAVLLTQLPSFLTRAKQLPFKGLSVTMPLKEEVLPYLGQIDKEAQEIGAVNTLVLQGEQWIGYNTDGKGALNAIEKQVIVRGKRLVILGAGGAAKAIAYEAHKRGALITVLNRHIEKAQGVAALCQGVAKGLDQMQHCYDAGYDILINCTPCDLPIDPEYLLPQALIMDIRTKPKNTILLERALKKGCSVVYGYEMFIEQALLQYALWGLIDTLPDKNPLEEVALGALENTLLGFFLKAPFPGIEHLA